MVTTSLATLYYSLDESGKYGQKGLVWTKVDCKKEGGPEVRERKTEREGRREKEGERDDDKLCYILEMG